jgi:hypothetical protein
MDFKKILLFTVIFSFFLLKLNAQISTLNNPYGMAGHSHFWEEVDSTGAKWVRMWSQDGGALWGEIQPENINSYFWDNLDGWVKEIDNAGFNMMLTIRTGGDSTSFHPCKWTDTSLEPDVNPLIPSNFILYKEASFPPKNYQEWYNFVYTVVERYDGKHTDANGDTLPAISHFETQGENDIATYWYGTKEEYYNRFLPTFYRAVHDANPNAVVIGGSVTGESIGLTIIDNMVKEGVDIETIIKYYSQYFYNADNVTWTDIETELNASQRRIEFVKYSYKLHNDTVFYDIRGYHNYERWNKLRDHMQFERKQMLKYGYSKPLWGTEVGIWDETKFPNVPQHIHAKHYQKKMILQFVEDVKWFCFAPMLSNPNNTLWSIFSPLYELVPFGSPVAREARNAFAFIAKKINEESRYFYDYSDTVKNVIFHYFMSDITDKTFIAGWIHEGENNTVTIDLPNDLTSLIVYDYLGNSYLPSFSDSLTLDYTESPVFIEWEPLSMSLMYKPPTRHLVDFKLLPNYPNPFNSSTSFSYNIIRRGFVQLIIYNNQGQLIDVLVNEKQEAGCYAIKWNAENFCSGLYLFKFIFNNESIINKMILIQ